MTKKEIKANISAMLRRFGALTDEDKALIKQLCNESGIKASFNGRCSNCYQDALLLLKLHYGVTAPDADIITPSGHFVYHNGLKKVVWWWRHNYYELSSQSDDATIERYMAVHKSQMHFSPNTTADEAEKGETNYD
jgi:hypothetical protein